eukprot:5161323-Prymnesium_polylepis.1
MVSAEWAAPTVWYLLSSCGSLTRPAGSNRLRHESVQIRFYPIQLEVNTQKRSPARSSFPSTPFRRCPISRGRGSSGSCRMEWGREARDAGLLSPRR